MRYVMNKTPTVPTITMGSEDEMVSTAEEAIGLATSIALLVCSAAPATVCNQETSFRKHK